MLEIRRNPNRTATIPVERARTAFNSFGMQNPINSTLEEGTALKRKFKPFAGNDRNRDYRSMYRAVCECHERNNPPAVDRKYWQTHTPGEDTTPAAEVAYWEHVAEDMNTTANRYGQDPFIIGMLGACYDELEREYLLARLQSRE